MKILIIPKIKETYPGQLEYCVETKLDKQIEKFRVREVKELEKLEKISLREKREDYAGVNTYCDWHSYTLVTLVLFSK